MAFGTALLPVLAAWVLCASADDAVQQKLEKLTGSSGQTVSVHTVVTTAGGAAPSLDRDRQALQLQALQAQTDKQQETLDKLTGDIERHTQALRIIVDALQKGTAASTPAVAAPAAATTPAGSAPVAATTPAGSAPAPWAPPAATSTRGLPRRPAGPSTRCPTKAPNGKSYDNALNFKWGKLAPQQIRVGNPKKIAVIGRHWRQGKKYGPGVSEYGPELSSRLRMPVEIFTRFRSTKAARKDWNDWLQAQARKKDCKREYDNRARDPRAWEACWMKVILPDSSVVQTKFYAENKKWAEDLARKQYTVIDIGNPYDRSTSPFYQAELQALFGRSAKPMVVNLRSCNAYHPESFGGARRR